MAHNVEGNPTFERDFPDNSSLAEYDSLIKLYTYHVLKKRKKLLARTASNYWDYKNRDIVVRFEVKEWRDDIKVNEHDTELFKKARSTKESRKAHNDDNDKYFNGKHSDEIY